MGSIQARIIELLGVHSCSKNLFPAMAANLAFIIKDIAGPKVKARHISITFTEASYSNDYTGDTITVAVHLASGEFKVVASTMVEDERDIVEELHKEVNKLVEEILKRAEEEASDDEE